MRMIAEGAESKIYETEFAGIGSIIKRRIRKNYRITEIDNALRTQRTKKEAKIMGMASDLIGSPFLLLVDRYDIIMERMNGKMLDVVLSSNEEPNSKLFNRLGKQIAILHKNNIVHGDYTPANVLVMGNKPFIIDFGLAEITNSIEDKALDLLLMKRSVGKKQFEQLLKGYKIGSREYSGVIGRLANIEKRGRYNTRTLLTN